MDPQLEAHLQDLKTTEGKTLEAYLGFVKEISKFTVPDPEACYRRYAAFSLRNVSKEQTWLLADYAFVAYRQGKLPLTGFTTEFRAVLAYGLLKGCKMDGYLDKKAWLLLKETRPMEDRIRSGLPQLEELLDSLKEALPRMNEAFPNVVKDLH